MMFRVRLWAASGCPLKEERGEGLREGSIELKRLICVEFN